MNIPWMPPKGLFSAFVRDPGGTPYTMGSGASKGRSWKNPWLPGNGISIPPINSCWWLGDGANDIVKKPHDIHIPPNIHMCLRSYNSMDIPWLKRIRSESAGFSKAPATLFRWSRRELWAWKCVKIRLDCCEAVAQMVILLGMSCRKSVECRVAPYCTEISWQDWACPGQNRLTKFSGESKLSWYMCTPVHIYSLLPISKKRSIQLAQVVLRSCAHVPYEKFNIWNCNIAFY